MSILKIIQDHIAKSFYPKGMVPMEVVELHRYFNNNGPIRFEYTNLKDGSIIAVSNNFRFGSIVTSGKDKDELDKNIKDAILTSFDVSSAYAKEAGIRKQGEAVGAYATT